MVFYAGIVFIGFLVSCQANVIRNSHVVKPFPLDNAPNLFNIPGLSKNNRSDIRLVEGDIVVPIKTDQNAYYRSPKWPNDIVPVPVEFDSSYSDDDKNTIINAMLAISQATDNCIQFVWRDNNPYWLRIHPGQG